VLRTLTLCDGVTTADPPPSALPRGCYCSALEAALANELSDTAAYLRNTRARAVARASEIDTILRRRRAADDW
jgi:hypothetical protein